MQVNSAHYGRLEEIGVTRDRLLGDWCICLLTGAQVLGEMMDATDGDLWDAVAAYNAGPNNIAGGRRYAAKVHQALDAIHAVQARAASPGPPAAPGVAAAGDSQLEALAAQLRGSEKGMAHAP